MVIPMNPLTPQQSQEIVESAGFTEDELRFREEIAEEISGKVIPFGNKGIQTYFTVQKIRGDVPHSDSFIYGVAVGKLTELRGYRLGFDSSSVYVPVMEAGKRENPEEFFNLEEHDS